MSRDRFLQEDGRADPEGKGSVSQSVGSTELQEGSERREQVN